MDKETSNRALAMLNRPQDVTFTVPLKLAVIIIAWALKSKIAEPFRANILAMQNEVAKQLKIGG
jgi:hypothetical protein